MWYVGPVLQLGTTSFTRWNATAVAWEQDTLVVRDVFVAGLDGGISVFHPLRFNAGVRYGYTVFGNSLVENLTFLAFHAGMELALPLKPNLLLTQSLALSYGSSRMTMEGEAEYASRENPVGFVALTGVEFPIGILRLNAHVGYEHRPFGKFADKNGNLIYPFPADIDFKFNFSGFRVGMDLRVTGGKAR